MKKLNLKMKGIGDLLSKEQMKNVVGAQYPGCLDNYWLCYNDYEGNFGVCGTFDPSGSGTICSLYSVN